MGCQFSAVTETIDVTTPPIDVPSPVIGFEFQGAVPVGDCTKVVVLVLLADSSIDECFNVLRVDFNGAVEIRNRAVIISVPLLFYPTAPLQTWGSGFGDTFERAFFPKRSDLLFSFDFITVIRYVRAVPLLQ